MCFWDDTIFGSRNFAFGDGAHVSVQDSCVGENVYDYVRYVLMRASWKVGENGEQRK